MVSVMTLKLIFFLYALVVGTQRDTSPVCFVISHKVILLLGILVPRTKIL